MFKSVLLISISWLTLAKGYNIYDEFGQCERAWKIIDRKCTFGNIGNKGDYVNLYVSAQPNDVTCSKVDLRSNEEGKYTYITTEYLEDKPPRVIPMNVSSYEDGESDIEITLPEMNADGKPIEAHRRMMLGIVFLPSSVYRGKETSDNAIIQGFRLDYQNIEPWNCVLAVGRSVSRNKSWGKVFVAEMVSLNGVFSSEGAKLTIHDVIRSPGLKKYELKVITYSCDPSLGVVSYIRCSDYGTKGNFDLRGILVLASNINNPASLAKAKAFFDDDKKTGLEPPLSAVNHEKCQ